MRKIPKSGIFRKKTLSMKPSHEHMKLSTWKEELLANGKLSFSLEQVKQAFPSLSEIAIKRSLSRLSVKGEIVSIYKGYYLLISSQYVSRGILPPSIYIDALMKHLQRPYYLGLLNAAVFHGAGHQQPQEFFVFTNFPVLRTTKRKGIKVNYISIKEIPEKFLEEKKTESGYLKISSPAHTAIDLISFEKRIGGLSRAATVLSELVDEIKPENLNIDFIKHAPSVTLQRLGYILDKILNSAELAQHLYNQCKTAGIKFYRKPLKESGKSKGFPFDKKWKIIINTEIESDL